MEKTTQKRGRNFTPTEVEVLTKEIEKRKHLLFGPFKGACLTQFNRDKAWEKVAEAVNAVAPTSRSVEDLKKKFKDLKSRTKLKAKRVSQLISDGEDEAPLLAPLLTVSECRIASLIGNEGTVGIPGGIDTYRTSVASISPDPLFISVKTEGPPPVLIKTEPVTPIAGTSRERSPSPMTYISAPVDVAPCNSSVLEVSDVSMHVPPAPSFAEVEPPPKKRKRRRVIDEIKETTRLQKEQNEIWREMLEEFRIFRSEFQEFKEEFISVEKRKLALEEEKIYGKKSS